MGVFGPAHITLQIALVAHVKFWSQSARILLKPNQEIFVGENEGKRTNIGYQVVKVALLVVIGGGAAVLVGMAAGAGGH